MSKALFAEDVALKVGGRTVLSDINLSIEKGSICAICGGEDSGKEYFKNILQRQYKDKYKLTGQLTLNGMEIELLPENDMRYVRMLDVGVLPGEISSAASKYMTGKSYITMPFGEKISTSKKDVLLDAKRLLDIMQIKNPDALLRKRTAAMSKRELRAVYYAAALATSPSVLISFGPEEGVNDAETEELFNLVIKICKIKNIAMLVLTDSASFAERFCERIFFLKQGKLTEADENRQEYDFFKETEHTLKITKGEVSEEILSIVNVVPEKKSGYSINAGLHLGEILGVHSSKSKEISKMFSGEKTPCAGEILRQGENICRVKKNRRGVFKLWDDIVYSFPKNKTVKEVITEYACAGSAEKKADRSLAVYNAITLSGLGTGISDTPVGELSKVAGVKLGIACALACGAQILVASGFEKFKNISRYEVLESVSAVCSAQKAGVLLISEDRQLLGDACHKIISE